MADTKSLDESDKTPETATTTGAAKSDVGEQESGTILMAQESEALSNTAIAASRADGQVHFEEQGSPPDMPPRPTSPRAQAENTLIEAFPSIDAKVVKAVLVASGGQVEPAFNALLGMSDPSALEEAPPPQPPRPSTTAAQKQLEEDEMYARQLAQHYSYPQPQQYNAPLPLRQDSRGYRTQRQGPNYQGSRQTDVDPEDKDYSFFDDDLPQIRENLKQGFLQTQTKVNKWISDFQKRIDGDDDHIPTQSAPAGSGPQRHNFGPSQSDQLYGIQKNADAYRARRSTDFDRYDADPQVLSDNFSTLEMRDEEGEDIPPPKPARPTTNPNLFKSTPPPPQSGPVDEVEALYNKPSATSLTGASNRRPSPTPGKSGKWQPLTSVAAAPDPDDNDPFALGDSDDEKELKSSDIRPADTQRLQSKAAEGGAGGSGKAEAKDIMPTETSGTRNKEVEGLMSKDT